MISYTVPGKPVGQNRNGANSTRPYGKTPEQKAYAALLAARGFMARRMYRMETTTDHVVVIIAIFFENERPDTDGPVKPILDSLEVSRPKIHRPGAGWLANDKQVTFYGVKRRVDAKRPRVEISIYRAATEYDQALAALAVLLAPAPAGRALPEIE